jgi:hypothetical protein
MSDAIIMTGTMDGAQDRDLVPQEEYYCKRKRAWVKDVEGLVKLEG